MACGKWLCVLPICSVFILFQALHLVHSTRLLQRFWKLAEQMAAALASSNIPAWEHAHHTATLKLIALRTLIPVVNVPCAAAGLPTPALRRAHPAVMMKMSALGHARQLLPYVVRAIHAVAAQTMACRCRASLVRSSVQVRAIAVCIHTNAGDAASAVQVHQFRLQVLFRPVLLSASMTALPQRSLHQRSVEGTRHSVVVADSVPPPFRPLLLLPQNVNRCVTKLIPKPAFIQVSVVVVAGASPLRFLSPLLSQPPVQCATRAVDCNIAPPIPCSVVVAVSVPPPPPCANADRNVLL